MSSNDDDACDDNGTADCIQANKDASDKGEMDQDTNYWKHLRTMSHHAQSLLNCRNKYL